MGIDILYVSTACSKKVFNTLFPGLSDKSGIAAQKFHHLLLEGLASVEDTTVTTLTTLPVTPSIHRKKFWNVKPDYDDGIRFRYIPIANFPFIKNVIVFFYSFAWFLFWKTGKRKRPKIVICDILSFSISSAAFLAFKIRGVKNVALVTDIPGINVMKNESLRDIISRFFVIHYNGYILLTRQMNDVVNPSGRPYMIMEGLVHAQMRESVNILAGKSAVRILMYAGGLYERYGIKNLILAFMKLESKNIELHLYGEGPMVADMAGYMASDPRIHYKGVVPNSHVVAEQLKATLLINPRPVNEEFSKYSFPSKNMEYMASGTPLVATLLPGMPEEYRNFIYLFNDETVEGIYTTLKTLLDKTDEELHFMGKKAKNFVLTYKNNMMQATRILDFFKSEFLQPDKMIKSEPRS